nr:MarR family transcriptional regulator [Petrotogaceae bacterium]
TYTSYIAMLSLWEKDGVTVKELGDTLFLDSGTLTPLLKKLEISGYISRKRDAKDERNLRIFLTKKGQELKERSEKIPSNLLCSIYNGDYCDNSEMIKLRDTLHNLMRRFLSSEGSSKT